MSDKEVICEVFKRADGSIERIGNSYEVDIADAKELVASGKYKFRDQPYTNEPEVKMEVEEEAEAQDDGRDQSA